MISWLMQSRQTRLDLVFATLRRRFGNLAQSINEADTISIEVLSVLEAFFLAYLFITNWPQSITPALMKIWPNSIGWAVVFSIVACCQSVAILSEKHVWRRGAAWMCLWVWSWASMTWMIAGTLTPGAMFIFSLTIGMFLASTWRPPR